MNGELKDGVKLVNWRQIHKVAAEAMKRVGVKIDPDIRLERLSVANKQLVAICRAIMNDARLLILDEPTTALTAREVESLWDIIRALKKKGIPYTQTENLEEVIGDLDILYMTQGRSRNTIRSALQKI